MGNDKDQILSEAEYKKKKIKNPRKTNPVHLLVFFILLAIILLPLFFKKEIGELDSKLNDAYNKNKIEKFNDVYSLKPVALKLKFSDQFSVDMTIPEAYLALGNAYKSDGVLSDILSTRKLHLAASLPDMEPWKLTREILDQIQQDTEILKDKNISTINKIFRSDHNFISINIISFMPSEHVDLLQRIQHGSPTGAPEEKYGLRIYNTEIAVPSILEGKPVYFYHSGIIAQPTIPQYTNMLFVCDAICTIIVDNGMSSLAVSFHSTNLAKWQEIWEKANSKVNSMMKWDIK